MDQRDNKDKRAFKIDQQYLDLITDEFLTKFKNDYKTKFQNQSFEIDYSPSKGVVINGTNCY